MRAILRPLAAVAVCAAGLGLAAVSTAAAPTPGSDGGPKASQAKDVEIDLIKRPAKRFERSIEAHLERVAKREARRQERREATREAMAPDVGEVGVSQSTLDAIAACESGGNPAAVNSAGYYGKYQFAPGTWQSVGGSGNPAAAPESEQDYRAALLYSRAGSSPWPTCGV